MKLLSACVVLHVGTIAVVNQAHVYGQAFPSASSRAAAKNNVRRHRAVPTARFSDATSFVANPENVNVGQEAVTRTVRGGKEDVKGKQVELGASIPNEVFNLVKSIMGAAIFTLPAGMAAFANSPMGVIPTTALLGGVGLLSGYCFSLIGRVCAYTGADSYKEAWARSVGKKSSWIPNLSSLLTTLQALIAYSIVVSGTVPQLLTAAGIAGVTRTQALLSVTSVVLLPLCLMKKLSALAPFSLVGLGGLLYTSMAMLIRLVDGSYAPGGFFFQQLDPIKRPSFGTTVNILSPAVFLLASRMSNAFMAHYQAPRLYSTLRNNTVPRFQRMVGTSYGIVFLAYSLITAIGFLTFGQASSGFILNNYASSDPLISGSRFAILLSLLTSFPLTFVGLRDNIMDFIGLGAEQKENNRVLNICSVALLSFITVTAYFVNDIASLLSFGGATYANFLTFLYPTVMFLHCAKRLPKLRKEIPAAVTTLIIGMGMAAIGTKEFIRTML